MHHNRRFLDSCRKLLLSVIEPLGANSKHNLDLSALCDCSEYVVWNSPKAVAVYTQCKLVETTSGAHLLSPYCNISKNPGFAVVQKIKCGHKNKFILFCFVLLGLI